MSSGLAAEKKLTMSLDDLISAEKSSMKASYRERSPRRAHTGGSRHRKPAQEDIDIDSDRRRTNGRSRGWHDVRMTDERRSDIGSRSGGSQTKTVKVTNIPFDLGWKDVKEAFSKAGEIERCDIQKGTAWITFYSSIDAQRALRDYDGGDMNGRTIRVSLS